MTKKIGIVGFYRNDMFGVHTDYLKFVEQFGTPVIIPQVSKEDFLQKFKGIEGLILPGGADVDPYRYGESKLKAWILQRWYCYPPDSVQEHFDTQILPELIEAKLPIFGICRGLQTLNVHFGGTLKNVYNHPNSLYKADLVHEVKSNFGHVMRVNSFHHQIINHLGKGLRILVRTPEGIPEAIVNEDESIVAVQWHPERFVDNWSNTVCKNLLFS